MLTTEPHDPFLHYALALEIAKVDAAEAVLRLAAMNAQFPSHVPAYFRHGQLLAETGQTAAAREVLVRGIATARSQGDDHAAAEMAELMESLSP